MSLIKSKNYIVSIKKETPSASDSIPAYLHKLYIQINYEPIRINYAWKKKDFHTRLQKELEIGVSQMALVNFLTIKWVNEKGANKSLSICSFMLQ